MLAWLSVWREVQMILHMVQLMPPPPHHFLLQQKQEWFTFPVSANPGYPGKKAVKRM